MLDALGKDSYKAAKMQKQEKQKKKPKTRYNVKKKICFHDQLIF